MADLAVAAGCDQIKAGSASRSDRQAKWHRLILIAEELGSAAGYAGPFDGLIAPTMVP